MSLPNSPFIELPILQELYAVGGADDVRFIYQRLISYFPSLSDAEKFEIQSGRHSNWKKAVQKAGKSLDEAGLIVRDRGYWRLTAAGNERAEAETSDFTPPAAEMHPLTHGEVQDLLLGIGNLLGRYAEKEYEFYDVIWRESVSSIRISHVFEVQSKGNIDSAFAKLKRAYDAQRSRPFLVLSSERDTNRARRSLENEFRELSHIITIMSFAEIRKLDETLREFENVLPALLGD